MSPSATSSGNHPIVRFLASFPIACFTCALFTDFSYMQTARIMWADFSAWLLAVGMAGGVIAAAAGLIGLLMRRHRDGFRPAWPVLIGSLLVLVVAFLNNLVHSRDAWTSVVPTGLTLSCITVLLMLATSILAARAESLRRVVVPSGEVRR